MPTTNADIARIFKKVADILSIQDANQYRIRAYRNAAQTIERHPRSLADMVQEGEDLSELHGIGEDLAEKIEEIVETGHLEQLDELEKEGTSGLSELMDIPGLGPKRVKRLHDELDIDSLEELKAAAEQNEIQEVSGFGEKTEEKILDNIERAGEKRTLWFVAEQAVGPLVEYMQDSNAVDKITVAGSYRRRKDTVGDLDIVIVSEDGEAVGKHFVEYDSVDKVISRGSTRTTVLLKSGLQVDIRVVEDRSYGAALHYFTGSKAHNLALRNMALDRDLKINEYGLWDGDEQIAGATEEEMYSPFDMVVVPPELRENRGEIEAAKEDDLPDLITLDDIRGDLHAHTTGSDGQDTLKDMAQTAQERGYIYLAITDHSPNIAVTQGLDKNQLAEQIDTIDKLNEDFDDFRLLKSCEVDILEDGSLDLPDDILEKLDVVVCSIHSHFELSRAKQTKRLLTAMENPYFNILGHPTGRRLNEREGMDIDMEKVMETALERNCFLEINADPNRLDLNDDYARMARDMGLKLVISTDSHKTSALGNMRYGIFQARRGWLSAEDVLNTRTWVELKKLLKKD